MFSIAICDDEEYFCIKERQLILKYMAEKECKCKIDMFKSGKELLRVKDSIFQYNIIFLDVNMEEIDGIETAREIRKITKDVYIVFVTAFITYAPEGYKVDAVRYLLKDDESLEKAVNECLDTILQKMVLEENKMIFEFKEGKRKICLENIVYIESNLHKLVFHMVGKNATNYTIYTKLDNVDELLRDKGFCRIHKSYLVNLKYIESVERYRAVLSDGQSLAISKARYLYTRDEFAYYWGEV